MDPVELAYGDHSDQVGDLHVPAGEGLWPTVVLVHGGFWRLPWDRTLMTPLALDLVGRGFAAWNIEYRRVGQEGGGWPGTMEDVAAAVDAVASFDGADTSRVVTIGHSAGGHLALWLAARHRLAAGQPGASPRVRPCAAVSLAGVADLVQGAADGLGAGACEALLGGTPEERPERYAAASPRSLLPFGVPLLLVHGSLDDDVPSSQSHSFALAAREAGDAAEAVELPGAGHFDVIDPCGSAWADVVEWLPVLAG